MTFWINRIIQIWVFWATHYKLEFHRERDETCLIISNTESLSYINLTNHAIINTVGFKTESTAAMSASDLLQIKLSIKMLPSVLQTIALLVSIVQSRPQVRKYFTLECVTNTILSLRNPKFPMCLTVIGLYFLIQG